MTDRDFATIDEMNEAMRREFPPEPGVGRLVAGEGAVSAAIAFVGEQPGDVEDREGSSFVGACRSASPSCACRIAS